MNPWRAGCAETCKSGSEGGPRKRTGRNPDTAPRPDPYTEHPTREGKIYCCAVIDAFSRMVVGWSIDSRQTGLLVANALGMALNRRAPREGGIIHSDQGVQAGLNGSSQHLDRGGVDGQASWLDEGVDGQGADEVTWEAVAASRRGAVVLA
jgi:Integrase core domain